MKKFLLITAIIASVSAGTFAKGSNEKKELVGSWKYTNASAKNDLQKISDKVSNVDYVTEYFTFQDNNKFKHEFLNENGAIVKTLKGKWKVIANKIKIEYNDFNYNLNLDYFFLDKDLVLGQNFSHIIFSKGDMNETNTASVE